MKIIRKLLAVLAVSAVLTAIGVTSSYAAETYPKAYINASQVNIRSGAGTNYSIVANLAKKSKVTLLNGRLFNKNWYRIKTASKIKGYVHKDYLTINKNQVYIPSTSSGYAGYTVSFKNFVNTTGKTAKWTSSNKAIATVSNGKVTCIKAGTVKIKVKAGSKSAISKLTIAKASVTLSDSELTLFSDDDPVTLTATCVKSVAFSSSDKEVVTVDSNGVVTPVSVGTAVITAKSKSGSAKCTFNIVKREIKINVTKSTLYTDGYAIISPTGGKTSYTYESNNTDIITVDKSGIVHAVGVGTAKVTVTSGELSKRKTFTVKSGTGVNLSNVKSTLYANMTLYLKSTTANVSWKSSDSTIAEVDNGYVLGHKKGNAVITAYTATGEKDCLVSVKAAEAVKFVYTSENSVLLGDSVKLYAITDTARGGVKFKLTDSNGNSRWVKNPDKAETSKRITWTASTTMTVAGEYTIEAYSHGTSSSAWETSEGGKSTFYVSDSANRNDTSYSERRATTALLNNIASFEGYLSKVTPDLLVADTPTIGYGRVIYAGTTFYNGMTKAEAFAYLTKTVNDSGFTTRVNKFLTENNIKFNQAHFDALVDFSYNLGAYAIENDDDLMNVLLNTYGKADNKLKGYINVPSAPLKKTASDSAVTLKNLSAYATVTLSSTTVYSNNWYKVCATDGTTGYVNKAYITRRTTSTSVRDLRNTNYNSFKSNILPYHHASGNCYWGLLYRRIDEAEMFFFGDYNVDGADNNYKMKYYCARNAGFGVG